MASQDATTFVSATSRPSSGDLKLFQSLLLRGDEVVRKVGTQPWILVTPWVQSRQQANERWSELLTSCLVASRYSATANMACGMAMITDDPAVFTLWPSLSADEGPCPWVYQNTDSISYHLQLISCTVRSYFGWTWGSIYGVSYIH